MGPLTFRLRPGAPHRPRLSGAGLTCAGRSRPGRQGSNHTKDHKWDEMMKMAYMPQTLQQYHKDIWYLE